MLSHLRRALTLLGAGEKRRFFLALLLTTFAAVAQTLVVLSLMPFIVLLANPDAFQTNPMLNTVYELFELDSYRDYLLLFGLFGIAVLTFGNGAVAFEQWWSDRFLQTLAHRLKTRVLANMIERPYDYFVANHSARLSDIVLNQVERVAEGVIGAAVTIFGSAALAGFIVLMLLIVSFKATLLTLIGLLAAYLVIFLLLRRPIEGHGEELTELGARIATAVKETLDGVNEIKTRRAGPFFSARFQRSSERIAKLSVRYSLLSFLPHYLLESVVLTGFVAIALWFVFATADAGVSLAYLALYGMAIYRLVPALQGIFEGLSTVHHNADAVRVVMRECKARQRPATRRAVGAPAKEIAVEALTYRYANAECDQLTDVGFSIPAASSVCLFGQSGSGKTTILNLLAGLIRAEAGSVRCDGVAIGPETIDSWRGRIGFCPQRIFLFDDTIASNVAFGVAPDAVDPERVAAVCKLANFHGFVSGELPRGYDTVIGEQGVTLSGGQRQRLGIARTLYHDPDVLMFDEALTGLDARNRAAILDKVFALEGKTLIFASHATDIAARCTKLVVLEQGRITAEGRFEALLSGLPGFADLTARPARA